MCGGHHPFGGVFQGTLFERTKTGNARIYKGCHSPDAYPWPGNVRELQNRIKRAVLVAETPMLDVEGLDIEFSRPMENSGSKAAILPLKDESLEKESIANALKICNGHREQAAKILNINPATLYRKMKKYGLK